MAPTDLTAPEATEFASLGLPKRLTTALATEGISTPFPIQALCIPPALGGKDVCGKAKTGSGKTLAFGLPMIMRVSRATEPKAPRGLVLVPTRELAVQVSKVLRPLAASCDLRVAALYGGASIESQTKQLRRGVDIVVATPGRLIDLGDRGELSVAGVEMLVLDEADRMADMGFLPQVEWVLRRIPAGYQTLLFSATLDSDVDHLVRHYLREPEFCEVEAGETIEAMEHRFVLVHQLDKVKVAAAVASGVFRTLVFVRTKRGADRLVEQLRREGVKSAAIHGDLRQSQRERALKDFEAGTLGVLVATDVAARGIHVDGIDVVVHYDPPEDHKAYTHRSGRTARAGEAGVVVTLVLWDQQHAVEGLLRRLGLDQPIVEMFSNDERLRDLRAWTPDVRVAPVADASLTPPRAVTSHGRAHRPRSSGPAPASPADLAAAVVARKQARRAMGGRRRGRR